MARKPKAEVVPASEAVVPEAVGTEMSGPVAQAEGPKGKKAKQTSFDVLNKNETVVRTYDVDTHGADAEDLATAYAKKIGGSVK
jgi:hypothetical protein